MTRPELPCTAPEGSFSFVLSMVRRAAGVPPVEMARRLGVQQPVINNYENGKHSVRETTVQRYAVALKMTARLVFLKNGKPSRRALNRSIARREGPCMAPRGSWAYALAMLRRGQGISKSQMAKKLNVSLPVVVKAESGKGHLLEHTVRRHAAALGMTVELVLEPRGGRKSRVVD